MAAPRRKRARAQSAWLQTCQLVMWCDSSCPASTSTYQCCTCITQQVTKNEDGSFALDAKANCIETLHGCLMKCAPAYPALFAAELQRKLELVSAVETADDDDDDADAGENGDGLAFADELVTGDEKS